MKKIFIPSTFIIYHLSFIITNAQSTTILPNRLSVPNVLSLSTCDNASKGSTVFNTTDNKMYYCNGTNWQEMTGGGFSLPYIATQAGGSYTPLLHIKTTSHGGFAIIGEATEGFGLVGINNAEGYGVVGRADASFGIGVEGDSKNGIGVKGVTDFGSGGYFEATDGGNAIQIKGTMNINSTIGAGGAQLVVPSNGNNPIWQNPVAFSVNDLGANDISVANTTDIKLPFTVEQFDLGNAFSTVNSEFTAPVRGIYHFDSFIMWKAHTNGTGYVALTLRLNGVINSSVRVPAVSGKDISNTLSFDVLLNANDKVTMYAYQTSGVAQLINQSGTFTKFTGHLVYRQ